MSAIMLYKLQKGTLRYDIKIFCEKISHLQKQVIFYIGHLMIMIICSVFSVFEELLIKTILKQNFYQLYLVVTSQ